MANKFNVRLLKQCVAASVLLALVLLVNLMNGNITATISETVSKVVADDSGLEQAQETIKKAHLYLSGLDNSVIESDKPQVIPLKIITTPTPQSSPPPSPIRGERIDEDILNQISERQDLYNNTNQP